MVKGQQVRGRSRRKVRGAVGKVVAHRTQLVFYFRVRWDNSEKALSRRVTIDIFETSACYEQKGLVADRGDCNDSGKKGR